MTNQLDSLNKENLEKIENKESKESKEVILSAVDVHRDYKNGQGILSVLKGLNLDVYAGEFLVIVGESGCGKSTLLNLLGGMDSVTSGSITFLGSDIATMNKQELTHYRRDNIGFIFQDYNLMPNLNVKNNLEIIGELVDNPRDTDEVLDLVGLADKKFSYPSELSGGQQQRVSIARALIKNPSIIFADEPTAALDYDTSIEVLYALEKVVQSGTTLVMVTHNNEITRMADRIVKLQKGIASNITVNENKANPGELVW